MVLKGVEDLSEDKSLDLAGIGKSLEVINGFVKSIQESREKRREKVDNEHKERWKVLQEELRKSAERFDECFEQTNIEERNHCIKYTLLSCGELLAGAIVGQRTFRKDHLNGETWEEFLIVWNSRFHNLALYDKKIVDHILEITKLSHKKDMVEALYKFEELFFVYINEK